MELDAIDPGRSALLIADLQNDFVHPDGAYARGGQANADIASVPGRVVPVARMPGRPAARSSKGNTNVVPEPCRPVFPVLSGVAGQKIPRAPPFGPSRIG